MHENLCNFIHDELAELDRKVKTGGKLTAAEVEYADMLAHLKKSLLTAEAMEEDDGYSQRGGMSYRDGRGMRENSMRGNSYAGRRNARRDSLGRYSRNEGYSYGEDGMHEVLAEMRDMMTDLPAEKQQRVRQFISEMERM